MWSFKKVLLVPSERKQKKLLGIVGLRVDSFPSLEFGFQLNSFVLEVITI